MVCSAVAILGLLGAALGTPFDRPYAVKETHYVPRKWSKVARADPEHTINLQIGLKQRDIEGLRRRLHEVSDPSHPKYGDHLSKDEVDELAGPSDNTLGAIQGWLESQGLPAPEGGYDRKQNWITLALPVNAVENLLRTEYHVFEHTDGSQVVRAPEWSLPVDLHEHVLTIQPTTSFFRAIPKKTTYRPVNGMKEVEEAGFISKVAQTGAANVSGVCNPAGVTPQCLRTLYNTIDYTPQAPGKNKVAQTDYLNETAFLTDIASFIQKYRPDAAGAKPSFEIIANGDNQQTPYTQQQIAAQKNAEANLDAETLIGITHPTPLIAYNTGGEPPFKPDQFTTSNTNEPYLEWLNYMLAKQDGDLPQTISTSYGDDEQTVPLDYAKSVCDGFMALGARGVSILFASGDNGVGPTGDCVSNDGKNTSMFLPSFPPSCPYVTVVGGTKNFNPEVVAYDPQNDYSSGGGYSNYFAQPDYQKTVVANYTGSIGNQFQGLYNKSGRAYPDIAAQGQQYFVVWNGRTILLDGTSASTPAASGVIALMNDALIAAGKNPMGFLNPWLYQTGFKAFTDITSGSARGCGGAGFPAKAGWDPATGFGTPDFKKLRSAVGA